MARIRSIKPEFFKHDDLFDLECETGFPIRIAFAGLWTVADREGRFKWRPRRIKPEVLPHDDVDMARVLDALWTRGFLVKYTSGTEIYGWIPTFSEHQSINNRETASVLPGPNGDTSQIVEFNGELTCAPRVVNACPTGLVQDQGEGKGREGKGREGDRPAQNTRASTTKGSRLPDDWSPTPEDVSFAEGRGLNAEALEREAVRFRNYWTSKSGRDATKTNWHRTWQNWILNDYGRRRDPPSDPILEAKRKLGIAV